ncbi:hypothetical protein [Actinomadura sp. KC345]|uniref:hypothetical protein n=1 Tax=Actinomadura sp. KC345 TaxID=2530371 RepID=UPI001404F45B|nr:hypothetical protein [Actinomadura sp. KC345]
MRAWRRVRSSRAGLRGDLGVEPGLELREAERSVLAGEFFQSVFVSAQKQREPHTG